MIYFFFKEKYNLKLKKRKSYRVNRLCTEVYINYLIQNEKYDIDFTYIILKKKIIEVYLEVFKFTPCLMIRPFSTLNKNYIKDIMLYTLLLK